MENEKNVNAVEVIKTNYNGFELLFSNEVVKRIYEMSDEDVEKLSNVNYCAVSTTYNKKTKTWRYILEVHFVANRIIQKISLTLKKMNLICYSHKIPFDPERELPSTRINCKVRFLHGMTSSNSLNPNKPYISCQLFPIAKNDIGLPRNSKVESFFVDDDMLSEFLIYKIIDKITFKTASSEELEPIGSFEDIQY